MDRKNRKKGEKRKKGNGKKENIEKDKQQTIKKISNITVQIDTSPNENNICNCENCNKQYINFIYKKLKINNNFNIKNLFNIPNNYGYIIYLKKISAFVSVLNINKVYIYKILFKNKIKKQEKYK